ncbi:uncharacterized protein LOC112342530 [Selaginella moellendorffii]|uniref:uncharacterized protein LOC112342530 n=1 Tax=Selaginella moellendorffii TaxID=88036 RepID=UPI000D1C6BB3|nr:uncharacterized protein LOC112342530 [Selaginella moellendorffii]|eukprot:XP_024520276.1 uncharacterized protein LOC112342530 [Selaginella moellendorffii]
MEGLVHGGGGGAWSCAGAAAVAMQRRGRQQPVRLRASASSSSRSGDPLERLAEEARQKVGGAARTVSDTAQQLLRDARRRAQEFQEEQHVRERVRKFTRSANQRMEDMGFEVRRNANEWNRKYRFTHRGAEFVDYVKDQLHAADSRLRIRQRARMFGVDARMKWPTYRRRVSQFLDTPLGKLVSTIMFAWLVLSGWIFKVFVISMWVLPIAAPLLIGTIARNTIVEGACPNCKTQFIGSRGQVIVCRGCRNVVWQPRDDFSSSKGTGDPDIIDIDVENT